MNTNNTSDAPLTNDVIIIAFAVIFLLFLLVASVKFVGDFLIEWRYLKSEIARSQGKEQLRWKRRLRRLWLSLIPFIKY